MPRVVLRMPDGREVEQAKSGLRIEFESGEAVISGARVNGQAVDHSPLRPGDKIQAGDSDEVIQVVSVEVATCTTCDASIPAGATLCPDCEEPVATSSRELKTEAHLLAVGFWWRMFGLLGISMGFFIMSFGFKGGDPLFGASGGVVLLLGIPVFLLGRGIGRFKSWARKTANVLLSILIVISIMGLVIRISRLDGTLFSLARVGSGAVNLVLYLVTRSVIRTPAAKQVCSEEYLGLMAAEPDVSPSLIQSPFFWIYMALMFGGSAILLYVFYLSGPPGTVTP